MSRKILAFYSPYPGAGKTTASLYFDPDDDSTLSFAIPLYRLSLHIMQDELKMDAGNVLEAIENKEAPIEELGGASFRDMLIAIGAAGRSVYSNLWSDVMRRKIRYRSHRNFYIDDLRFPNEYKMLREEGAKIVRITNPGREIVPSETEALLEGYKFDAQLVNDPLRGAEHYHAQLDAMMAMLFAED